MSNKQYAAGSIGQLMAKYNLKKYVEADGKTLDVPLLFSGKPLPFEFHKKVQDALDSAGGGIFNIRNIVLNAHIYPRLARFQEEQFDQYVEQDCFNADQRASGVFNMNGDYVAYTVLELPSDLNQEALSFRQLDFSYPHCPRFLSVVDGKNQSRRIQAASF